MNEFDPVDAVLILVCCLVAGAILLYAIGG